MGIIEQKPIEWVSYLWTQSRPASSSDIEQVERELNVHFPDDYKAIVIENQGKVPQQSLFDFLENGQQTTSAMGALFHFLEDKSDTGYYSYNLLENYRNRKHLLLPQIVPFSEDPAGNSIAFDFHQSSQGAKIVFVNHEAIGEANWVSEIAENFSTFLNLLYEDSGVQ